MTNMDALPPDDSTPESRAWEEWAGKLKVGDRIGVTEPGPYHGRCGRIATIDHDDAVMTVRLGEASPVVLHLHEVGPPEMPPQKKHTVDGTLKVEVVWDDGGDYVEARIGRLRFWLASIEKYTEGTPGQDPGAGLTVYGWGTFDTRWEHAPEIPCVDVDEARSLCVTMLRFRGVVVAPFVARETK